MQFHFTLKQKNKVKVNYQRSNTIILYFNINYTVFKLNKFKLKKKESKLQTRKLYIKSNV